MENNKDSNIFNQTTKLTLVVYFPLLVVFAIICLICSGVMKPQQWPITYGFLVCLLPSVAFVLISAFMPIEKVFTTGKKKLIFGWVVLYVVKYVALFIVPILCTIFAEQWFNKWVMLTLTLLTPIVVFVIKIITTYSSKNKEKDTKTPINTIKF